MKELTRKVFQHIADGTIDANTAADMLTCLKTESNSYSSGGSDIAIIGMSCRFPGAYGIDEFWNILKNGIDMVGSFPESRKPDADRIARTFLCPKESYQYTHGGYLEDIDKFDCNFFHILPAEADIMDPNQRLFLEHAYNAIRDAGYEGCLQGSRTGVYLGNDNWPVYGQYISKHKPDAVTDSIAGNVPSVIASRISYLLDLKGPAMLIDTACSSSLLAVHTACQGIHSGDCDMALAGGVKISFVPVEDAMNIGQESKQGRVRTFDAQADGFVWGEGVAAILLKPLDQALTDRDNIYAVIKGSSANQDGASMGIMAPNARAQEQVLTQAWKASGIHPRDISYIELHGTGTKIGDPIEKEGITLAFEKETDDKQFCAVGSLKTNLGHLDNASGIASVVKMALSLREKILPAMLHFMAPNEELQLQDSPLYVNARKQNWSCQAGKRICGINSFGVSGTNVHLVMEEAPQRRDEPSQDTDWNVLTISAKTQKSLKLLVHRYRNYFAAQHDLNLRNVCYTANVRRHHWKHRICILFRGKQELMQHLDTICLQVARMEGCESIFYSEKAANKQDDTLVPLNQLLLEVNSLKTLCQAYVNGDMVDWEEAFQPTLQPATVHLPSYPFERARHWVAVETEVTAAEEIKKQNVVGEDGLAKPIQINKVMDVQHMTVTNTIKNILAQTSGLEPEQISEEMSFLEMGFDSISLIKVRHVIMDLFGIEITMRQFMGDLADLTSLATYVEQNKTVTDEAVNNSKTAVEASVPVDGVDHQLTLPEQVSRQEHFEGGSYYQEVINRQLELMEKQIALLRVMGGAEGNHSLQTTQPTPVRSPASAPAPVLSPTDIPREGKSTYAPAQAAHSGAIRKHIQGFIKNYERKTAASKAMTDQYRPVLANNRNVAGYRQDLKEITYQIIAQRAQGSKIWDVDGNEYIDISMGFGVYLFGHYPEFVQKALERELKTGIPIGPMNTMAGKAAKLLCEITGNERVAFYNTGTETVMVAVRIARAVTKRSKIVIFSGSYHGAFDGVLARSHASGDPERSAPVAPGITDNFVKDVVVLTYGSQDALQYIKENADKLAAILVEPVQSRHPDLQPNVFLHELREITSQAGTALIFDEMIVGFRINSGGAQQHFGVSADIVTYGKILGGGLPIGAVAGQAKFMDSIDGGVWSYGDDSGPVIDDRRTFVAGTFCNHPLAMSAACAVLEEIKKQGPAMYDRLNQKTLAMMDRLNAYFEQNSIPIKMVHFGSLFRFHSQVDIALLYYHLLLRGIYIWEGRNCFLSTAHTDGVIDRIVRAITDSLDEMLRAGYFPGAVKEGVRKKYPLSQEQRQIWFTSKTGLIPMTLSERALLRMTGDLNLQALQKVVHSLVERHELLRAKIDVSGEELEIFPRKELNTPVLDFTGNKKTDQIAEWMDRESKRDFDLVNDFLFRISVAKETEHSHLILAVFHRIIADGWSIALLLDELSELYNAECQNRRPSLPEAVQFDVYMEHRMKYRQSAAWDLAREYWLEQYKKPMAMRDIPSDYITGRIQKQAGKVSGSLSDRVYKMVVGYSVQTQTTLYTVLLSAFTLMLHKLTGSHDIIIGIPFAGQMLTGDLTLIGQCVNVLPFRMEINSLETYRQFVDFVREKLIDGSEHQMFSFADMEYGSHSNGRIPKVKYLFNMDKAVGGLEFYDLQTDILPNGDSSTSYDLSMNVVEFDGTLQLDLEYNAGLYKKEAVEFWMDLYSILIECMVSSPTERIFYVSQTQNRAPEQLTGTKTKPHTQSTILAPGAEEEKPRELTSAAVYTSDQVASFLTMHRKDIKGTIGVYVSNAADKAAAAYGIRKAGMDYILLPSDYSDALWQRCCGVVTAVIADFLDTAPVTESDTPVSVYALHDILQSEYIGTAVPASQTPGGCSVLCSDATNLPTLFSVSGTYLSARCADIPNLYGIRKEDKILQFVDPAYDGAAEILLPGLCAGAELLSSPNSRDIKTFYEKAVEKEATVVCLPADQLHSWARLVQASDVNIRMVIVIGEMFTTFDAARLKRVHSEHVLVWFVYRPEGMPFGLMAHRISLGDFCPDVQDGAEKFTFDIPLVPHRTMILNDGMLPAGTSEPGILYLSAGLLQDYTADASKKSGRLVRLKQLNNSVVELYQTDAVARYTRSWEIEPVGSKRELEYYSQCNLNPAEIRAAVRSTENVSSCAVIPLKKEDKANIMPVIAVYTESGKKYQTANEAKRSLPEQLSALPLVCMEYWPVCDDGRADLDALKKQYDASTSQDETGDVLQREEQLLKSIWSEVLNIGIIGIHENFFALGGYSLLAIQLMAKVSETFGITLSLQDLINAPTISDMAIRIREVLASPGSMQSDYFIMPRIKPQPEARWEPFPLTSVQQAYWVGRSGAFELGNIATHTYFEVDSDTLDVDRIEMIWRILIERHDMLRAVIHPDGRQKILQSVDPYTVQRYDLRKAEEKEIQTTLAEVRERMSHQVLPSDVWPLFEVSAAILPEGKTRVFLSIDALILDTWSFQILLKEMFQLYQNPTVILPPLELTFRDYVMTSEQYRNSDAYAKSRDYWLERLDLLPPAPALPLAVNPAEIKVPKFIRHSQRLPVHDWENLKQYAVRHGITQSGLLLAVYAKVLGMWCANPHFTINLTLFNPIFDHPQIDSIVGDFTSLTLMEIDNANDECFEVQAQNVQKQLWNDLSHRFFSGVDVIRELNHRHGNDAQVSMPIVFTGTLNTASTTEASTMEWMGDVVYTIGQTPQVWLDFEVFEENGCLVLNWDSVEGLFREDVIEDMFGAYCKMLYMLASDDRAWGLGWPDLMRDLLPVRHTECITAINETTTAYDEKLLHEAFCEQAAEAGERLAVITSERTLMYRELFVMANFLARQLQEMGARTNTLVAVVMEKSWEQIAAVMGILFSGAAYLPLSSDLPPERLKTILEDAQVELALVQSGADGKLELPGSVRTFTVAYETCMVACDAVTPLSQSLDDLAYVIYTSGSTGNPKGVMISHRGAWNTVQDINTRFKVSSKDRVLAISSLSFDLSVYDLFGLLSLGGTVVIPDAGEDKNPAHWLDMLKIHGVTIWNSVPALLDMLVVHAQGNKKKLPKQLRLALLSGDWVPVTLPQQVWESSENVEIISMGGATEASIWSCIYPIVSVSPEDDSIPYGKPLDNQKMYVLNDSLELCPAWVAGKIYIGGIGLTQGYWKNEEKTEKSFFVHPRTGERLYYTGDMGRYRNDGIIEFMGRVDSQIKINGYRVELGEIEHTILKHPAVSNVAVAALGGDKNKSSLAAYVVLDGEQKPAVIDSDDPIERFRFKQKQHGVRRMDSAESVQLLKPVDPEIQKAYYERRSYRNFAQETVTLGQIGQLLDSLRQIQPDQSVFPKYRYGSAGGLYPVQTYVYICKGKVEDVSEGLYYYHPVKHSLDAVFTQTGLTVEIDKRLLRRAAFVLFLIADYQAIQPLYGEDSERFCILEAGLISQLLETEAPKCRIGLCQFGNLDESGIRSMFSLLDHYKPLHCLVGGGIAEDSIEFSAYVQEIQGYEQMQKLIGTEIEPAASGTVNIQDELKQYLYERLPGYMVPASIVVLDELPLSANGKIDRKKLIQSGEIYMQAPQHTSALPQSNVEKSIESIIRKVIGLERIGVKDNFFDLGASSVDLIRIHNRLQEELQVTLPVVEIFRRPNIAALASYLTDQDTLKAELKKTNEDMENKAKEGKERLRRIKK